MIMALQQITEGKTGQEAANIIYQNDQENAAAAAAALTAANNAYDAAESAKETANTNASNLRAALDGHILDSSMHISPISEKGFAVCDIAGNAALYIDENGKTKINLDSIAASGFLQEITQKGFAVSDPQGNAAFYIGQTGETDLKLSRKALLRLKSQLDSLDSLEADYSHIITYGQSLGEGSQASPILTSTPFSEWGLMFNHGIKTRYAIEPKYQSFIEHVEHQDAENGETPAAGTAERFIQAFKLSNKFILSSCCARGGMSISQLSKGTTWYNNILSDVMNGKRLAETQGKTYRLLAVTWTQGEYDYGNGIDYYIQKAVQLRNDLIADVETITGDSYTNLPFITYQVSSSYSANKSYPDIGLAHLKLSENYDGFFLATPIYQMQYADSWHLRNIPSKILGAYYGNTLYNIISNGDWQPLKPISVSTFDNTVHIKFSKNNLVFEKPPYISATIANKGFSVKDTGGLDLITAVEIINSDTVKITCSNSPVGCTLTYGFNNSNYRNAGELRDNNTDSITISGTEYKLYNWCVIFEKSI